MQLNNRIAWLWMTVSLQRRDKVVFKTDRQSHFCFMAGLSFLYAYLNLHNTAVNSEGIPTLDEAIGDIESCLATLEYTARKSAPRPE